MAKERAAKADAVETVKTSVKLPKALWREASVRALDEGRDLQDVVAAALAAYLAPKRKGESR